MVMMKKKCSMGRQKITIEKIKKKNHLQVTFSKRRAGLFKKASELCTLCGVEIAIVIFSPAGKVFSFGHPDADSIANRFLSRNQARFDDNKTLEAGRNIQELNLYLSHINNQLEFERRELDQMKKESKNQYWWESPIDELGMNELQQLRNAMVELKKYATQHKNLANRFSVTSSNYSFSSSTLDDINRHADHMTTIPNNFGHGFGVI